MDGWKEKGNGAWELGECTNLLVFAKQSCPEMAHGHQIRRPRQSQAAHECRMAVRVTIEQRRRRRRKKKKKKKKKKRKKRKKRKKKENENKPDKRIEDAYEKFCQVQLAAFKSVSVHITAFAFSFLDWRYLGC